MNQILLCPRVEDSRTGWVLLAFASGAKTSNTAERPQAALRLCAAWASKFVSDRNEIKHRIRQAGYSSDAAA
eukprot:6180015-Pleurochrysis_carterae.AAC.3